MSNRQKAICILGMHRSGTSAITRALNLMGPYLGPEEHMMPPVEGDNPHGFWEHTAFFSLHERLLSHLQRSWDSILPLPDGWWKEPEIRPYWEELKGLVVSEFAGREVWMWKDPRTSLLLPLWKDVLGELGVEARYILCLRSPFDVAGSLLRRNNFSGAKSLSLWLLYTSSSLYWTAGEKRIISSYDELVDDWESSLRKVSSWLGIPWPTNEDAFREAMNDFLRPGDRHRAPADEAIGEGAGEAGPVARLYRLLCEALDNDEIMASEAFIRETDLLYRDYCAYVGMLVADAGWGRAASPQEATGGSRDEGVSADIPSGDLSAGMPPLPDPLAEMSFPVFPSCKVSIIIPVWNRSGHTYRCLKAILEKTLEVPYEVIVVDNGSADATGEVLAKAVNVRVIRNPENRGYGPACNQAAIVARGEYLLFLNNDTQVSDGWLMAMAGLLDGDGTAGAVGAKLILPDGRLQEAGGIVWHEGSTSGYGRGEDPGDPRFCYVRDVDYCSGACLLVRADLFLRLGGFDKAYSPAYYEDVDLCWGVKMLGYKVMYQPAAAVIHHEFGSGSRDRALALYMRNRPLFVRRWGRVLADQYSQREENMLLARDSRRRERVLIVDWRKIPSFGSAVAARVYDTAGYIADFGYSVTFLSLSPRDSWRLQAAALQERGVEVLCGNEVTVEDFLKGRADFYQLLFFFSPGNSWGYLKLLREAFPSSPAIYDASETEAIGGVEEDVKSRFIMTHVDDLVVASSMDMTTALTDGGLHGVVTWEYPPHREAGHDCSQEHIFILAGIIRRALKGTSLRPRQGEAGRHDRILQESRDTIREMERYITSLRETLAEKDRDLESMARAIAPKDEYIADLLRVLKEKDKYIESLVKNKP